MRHSLTFEGNNLIKRGTPMRKVSTRVNNLMCIRIAIAKVYVHGKRKRSADVSSVLWALDTDRLRLLIGRILTIIF